MYWDVKTVKPLIVAVLREISMEGELLIYLTVTERGMTRRIAGFNNSNRPHPS